MIIKHLHNHLSESIKHYLHLCPAFQGCTLMLINVYYHFILQSLLGVKT